MEDYYVHGKEPDERLLFLQYGFTKDVYEKEQKKNVKHLHREAMKKKRPASPYSIDAFSSNGI